jgi:translation initiation factor IF-2
MNDMKDETKKKLTLSLNKTPSTLQLNKGVEPKKPEDGKIIQARSGGKVVVQTVVQPKRKRDPSLKSADLSLDGLTTHERTERLRVLKVAEERVKRDEEERLERERMEEIARQQEEERLRQEMRLKEEQARLEQERAREQVQVDVTENSSSLNNKQSIQGQKTSDIRHENQQSPKEAQKTTSTHSVAPKPVATKSAASDEEDDENAKKHGVRAKVQLDAKRVLKENKVARLRQEESQRRAGKINVNAALDEESREKDRFPRRKKARAMDRRDLQEKQIRDVILPEVITVQELSSRMAERSADVVRELMKMGMLVTVNHNLDADTAELVILAFGHRVKRVTAADVENVILDPVDSEEHLLRRAPVVTIMGHVDHGKTSLLDALRCADVVSGEAGGITQHIGAYSVKLDNGHHITFLDTPGHEAFTAMRSRGAKVTDIVVLVVAADDGIMAQTVEAINHAKAANVPIIVAVNKIDKPSANPGRVREELLSHELVPEELGGDIMVVEVSAKQKINLDKLLETILLQAEILDLKANPDRAASGVIIESRMDIGRGVIASVLVQKGTLSVGDLLVAGASWGKVRAINNDKGMAIEHATPSMPVEILGLGTVPEAGDPVNEVETEKQARDIAEFRERRARDLRSAAVQKTTLEELFQRASGDSKQKELAVIVKADVQGSVEAIVGSLLKLATDEVTVRILHMAVGGITESDVILAQASKAVIMGFNVRANNQAKLFAQRDGVDIRYYSIIYNLVDDVKAAMSGMLSPILREEYLGSVEIRQVFNITKIGKVAGSYVTSGVIKRGAKVRLLRDNIVIHEGKLKTLRRFKDDVKEVKEGFECGIAFESYEDIREKDVVEVFEIIEERQSLA